MQNQTDVVTDCTSQVFEGLITLQNPKASWVAKWQRLSEYCEGVYATKVVGIVSTSFSFCEGEGGGGNGGWRGGGQGREEGLRIR